MFCLHYVTVDTLSINTAKFCLPGLTIVINTISNFLVLEIQIKKKENVPEFPSPVLLRSTGQMLVTGGKSGNNPLGFLLFCF